MDKPTTAQLVATDVNNHFSNMHTMICNHLNIIHANIFQNKAVSPQDAIAAYGTGAVKVLSQKAALETWANNQVPNSVTLATAGTVAYNADGTATFIPKPVPEIKK